MKPSTVDGKLCTQHKMEASRPKLVVIITRHADDLTLVGIREEVISVLQHIDFLDFSRMSFMRSRIVHAGIARTRSRK